MGPIRHFVMIALCAAGFWGCAAYNPRPLDESPFLERAQMQMVNNVRVRAAVPSAAETRQIFGVDLYLHGIQPVWIEIDNQDEKAVWFLPVGIDPLFYTPLEAAFLSHFRFSAAANERMNRDFFTQGKDIHIHAGSRRSGFVFTNLDEGTKSFAVDLVGEDHQVRTFTFFIPVPGLEVDHHNVDFASLYPPEAWRAIDSEEDFRAFLETLPCCATDKAGAGNGDPLNLVVIGNGQDLYHAFMRAGWDETEIVTTNSAWRTGLSYFFGQHYRYSPVSALYAFGRRQDVALQKARDTIHKRNHLRLWLAPVRFRGQLVWLGQISRDIGVRFTSRSILTHKIDPDVDETRRFLTQNLWYSQGLSKFALVKGVGAAPFDAPRHNLAGDAYFTDGLRAVLWVSSQPVAFEDVTFVPWEVPPE